MERLSRFKGKLGVGATNIAACLVSIMMFFIFMFSSGLPHVETKREFVDRGDSRGILCSSAMDTGAASASRDYKGGIIFLEPNTQYTMKGGTYSGGNKTYGGAVYISEGATFTMDGGTITNCKATYGGGIYVRAGATCNILSGSITGCSATYGPAIFVEEGGILNIEDGVDIDENDIMIDKVQVSSDKIQVGDTDSTLYLHYMEFGNYPQTYVGNTLNAELENWYNSTNPQAVGTYETAAKTKISNFLGKNDDVAHASEGGDVFSRRGTKNTELKSYDYNGEIYARGICEADSGSVFKDGTVVKYGTTYWFRVEPIKWAVLNYDEWKSGAKMKLMSMLALGGSKAAFNDWATSSTRSWLNNEFFNSAFNEDEKNQIYLTHLENDTKSSGIGTATDDYVYTFSETEMKDASVFPTSHSRVCSPADMVVSTYTDYWEFYGCVDANITTSYRKGTMHYLLRTARSDLWNSVAVVIAPNGDIVEHNANLYYPVRPFITLSI